MFSMEVAMGIGCRVALQAGRMKLYATEKCGSVLAARACFLAVRGSLLTDGKSSSGVIRSFCSDSMASMLSPKDKGATHRLRLGARVVITGALTSGAPTCENR